jgi:hypothetical protein
MSLDNKVPTVTHQSQHILAQSLRGYVNVFIGVGVNMCICNLYDYIMFNKK